MEMNQFSRLMKLYGDKIDIFFSEEQTNKFFKYMQLLLEWNEKINLTAITKPEEVILKHFIDSLTINKYIEEKSYLVDVGTGAGFPGIPLAIYRNDINIVLVDALNKRVNFLDDVIKKLELKNIKTVHSRAEDFGKNKEYRERFDVATARAVANMSVLAEYLIPLVKVGGRTIFMKGNNIEEELENSKKAFDVLGSKLNKIETFLLPESNMERSMIILDKIKNTEEKYPRKAGIPSKNPIL